MSPNAKCKLSAILSPGSCYSLILACSDLFTAVIMFRCEMYLWGSFVGILCLI